MSLSKKEKQKKPFYKRFWFIILMVFIVLGAIGTLNKSGTKIARINQKSYKVKYAKRILSSRRRHGNAV